GGVQEVLTFKIAESQPLPKARGTSLDQVVRKILSRIPTANEPTFLIHRRGIVLTTKKAASKLVLGDENQPLPPLVHRKFDKRPLEDALGEIAALTDVNVVVDESIGDKAKESVSARMLNTPVETAVRLLAARADLTSLRIDNTIYVTTRDKAAKLREDIE